MYKQVFQYIGLIFLLIVAHTSFYPKVFAQSTNTATFENLLSVYIYNFTKFIEWPQSKSDDFKICVWGENNIVNPLNTIAQKENVNGKRIVVNVIEDIRKISDCNILFVGEEDKSQLNKIIENIKGKNILLITNSAGFAKRGAGINFLRVDDKIKFEINKAVLEANKIIPSSRLLSLAVHVYE